MSHRLVTACFALALLASFAFAGPADWKPFFPKELKPRPGVKLFEPKVEPHEQAGVIQAKFKPDAPPVDLTPDNAAEAFLPVKTPAEARELCQLVVWGTLLDEDTLMLRIVSLYRANQFETREIPKRENRRGAECVIYPVERKFEVFAQPVDGGFDVKFTAFLLTPGADAEARIERLHCRVEKSGVVKILERIPYLEGPRLAVDLPLPKRADELQRRKDLIDNIYQLCPKLLPVGRSLGKSADLPKPPLGKPPLHKPALPLP
jgi:hypothetical protein